MRSGFRTVRKSLRVVGKDFRTVRKDFRVVGKSFRAVGKSFRVVRKEIRMVGKSFRTVRNDIRTVRKRCRIVRNVSAIVRKGFRTTAKAFQTVRKLFRIVRKDLRETGKIFSDIRKPSPLSGKTQAIIGKLMLDWFDTLATRSELPAHAAFELDSRGFTILPGPVPCDRMEQLTDAYTAAMSSASGPDVRVGSTSTRVSDFVNRGAEFDDLYIFPPLLDACRLVIGRPFKLSSLQARTLRPHTPAQELHVDVRRDSPDWPLLGFILMIDEFRQENGATRFVPGSHHGLSAPESTASEVLACAPAGSLILFNGSVWHGHTANVSDKPRRSLQGAFIPRDGQAATDFAARMQPETRARLSALALYLLEES